MVCKKEPLEREQVIARYLARSLDSEAVEEFEGHYLGCDECFDEMRVRFDRPERNMQMMAETVSLHARYHLALMPVLPQSRQHEASRVYDRYSRGLMAPSA